MLFVGNFNASDLKARKEMAANLVARLNVRDCRLLSLVEDLCQRVLGARGGTASCSCASCPTRPDEDPDVDGLRLLVAIR